MKLLDQPADAADDEVVAEVHDEVVVGEEVGRDEHGVREAERRILPDVGDGEPERRAVADRGPDLGLRVADDDTCLHDTGVAQRLEPVEEHRLVGDRHELLWPRCA